MIKSYLSIYIIIKIQNLKLKFFFKKINYLYLKIKIYWFFSVFLNNHVLSLISCCFYYKRTWLLIRKKKDSNLIMRREKENNNIIIKLYLKWELKILKINCLNTLLNNLIILFMEELMPTTYQQPKTTFHTYSLISDRHH